jgi:colicin import membrane protein
MRQNWIVPEGINPDISCQLAIRLNSDGTVISVTLLRSSGNTALDNSARMAVFKSSPLPVPADPDLFKQVFHEFNLTVSPKDIQE